MLADPVQAPPCNKQTMSLGPAMSCHLVGLVKFCIHATFKNGA